MKPLDPTVRPSRPELDVHVTENVPVAMRDGVRLATDVYRPARAGRPVVDPLPVLLHRTPNTGEPIGRDRRRVIADNTVFHERGRESKIVQPLIPLDTTRS